MANLPQAEASLLKCTSLSVCLLLFDCHWGKVLSNVFVRGEVVLLSLAHAPKCRFPVALLSYAPLLKGGGGTNVIRSQYRCHQQKQHQVAFSKICGSWPLRHQCRGMATTGNCEVGGVNSTAFKKAELLLKRKLKNERPRLICRAWWSKRQTGAVAIRGGDVQKAQTCSTTADLVDTLGGGGGYTGMYHKTQEQRQGKEVGMKVEQRQHNEEISCQNNCQRGDVEVIPTTLCVEENWQKRSPPVPATILPHMVAGTAQRHDCDDDGLVYNIFTHRVVKRSAASVRALAVLGIGVRHDTQELGVVNSAVLLELRNKLVRHEVSWPASWRNTLFRQLHHILLVKREEELVEEVRRLLWTHYERVKIRRGVGVVASDNSANFTNGVSSNETNVSHSMAFQERLFSYHDLNEEQQRVLSFVLEGHNTYIGGGAGTGKSLLLCVIKQELVSRGLTVAMTATTGIAATRIGGVTLHHCFGVNVHGECTRRAELQAFDVIIVDEVSMLSKELFESLEYQLRRANGVDLPFGGVQLILSGDFLQLGAIASASLVHSAIFRRYFAMLKLQQVVRQLGNTLFVNQLQELRRGIVPHNLQDTITFLSPIESAKIMNDNEGGAVKLLPTNREVDAVNQAELEKLPGELVIFPAQLQSPSLAGRWTATYILAVQHDDPKSVDAKKLGAALEQYVLEFVKKVPHASTITLSLFGQRHIVFYKLFVDAFVVRVRIPQEMNEKDEQELASYLRDLETWLPTQGLGVCLQEIVTSPNGLHTDVDEYTLTHYAQNSPMMSPLGLKKGTKVMLRTNLSSSFVNGSIGVVVGFKELRSQHLPRYLTNPGRLEAVDSYAEYLQYEHGFPVALAPEVDFGGGRVIVVPPTTFCVGGLSNTNHYHMGIVALPLSLAYAFTVHKVQGLTLVGRVHLQLSRMWPCDHLLYVAMSRVKNPEQLTVSHFHRDLVRCATECLLFDESLPPIERVRVLPHFFQATWRRNPRRRRAGFSLKKSSKVQKQENVNKQKGKSRRQVRISRGVF